MALQTSFSPSSSSCSFSSSSFSYAWKYDVFLSFRGPDTRHGFIGHLHKALSDKGISTFIDDGELKRGEKITTSLAKAIEESRIAIPVFSENYASSAFCLDELVKIMECVKGKRRLVLPVFYKVEPSDVRHQRGSYGKALARHEERFKDDTEKVQKWREALREAANLSGEHFLPGNEYERDLIVKIVKEISKRISRGPLHVANYPVGMESRVLEVNRLLNNGSDSGVHMVGIYGIGGIGKTTLAKVVYNSIADQFEGLCFLENMSELSVKNGLPYLQKRLLSEILGDKDCDLGSVSELIPIISERLRCKRVLLVLDNVDKHEQLQAIIGRPDWLGSGSRVIITTQNKHLLTIHEVKEVYEVGVLNEEEALELFTWMAFKSKNVEPCYMDILKKLVTYASGLPLALEVIGSSLFGRCVKEWRSALDEYQKIPNEDVQKKLIVSFDALHPHEKNIFLDIACCFKGYELPKVVDILHGHYGVDPTYTIRVLADKSLIKINNDFHGVITLHDLIQDMGREIVRLESPEKPGARSRLWLVEDIIEVLQEDEGSSKIQLINLECDYNGDVIEWDGPALKKMDTLRTLIVKNGRFSQGHKYLPSSLRVLKWEMHHSQEYLSFYFHPKQLVMLDLSRNCFDSVQVAELLKKKFENLRILRFDYCEHITKIPNLSNAPKLEVLSLECCRNLTEMDESVGHLDKLKTLDASECSQLRSLPPLMLPSLEYLGLDECSSLESFPEILGKMASVTRLSLYSVPIKKFPYSIHNLTGLRSLYLDGGGIVELPSSIKLLEQVETLRFRDCKGLLLRNEDEGKEQVSSMSFSSKTELRISDCNISEEFFRIAIPVFPRLESLRLKRVNFRILPKCIEEFQFLRKLRLFYCNKLEEIRGIPPNIEELFVVGCTSLSLLTIKCVEEFQLLRKLHLIDCEKLEEIGGIPPNIEELFVIGCTSWSLLTGRMLLNKKLHEEGQDRGFILPWNRLPMWFEYQRRESSITFWFRKKFPAISFGFFFPSVHTAELKFTCELTINGAKSFDLGVFPKDVITTTRDGLVFIFNKTQTTFRFKVDEVLSENEWNCAVFSARRRWRKSESLNFIEVGVHIIKEKGCTDDVRFTDPLLQKECGYKLRDMGDCQTHAQLVQQRMSSTTTTLNVQDRGAVLNPVESLDDVYGSSNSDSDSGPQSLVGSDVEQPLDDAYNNSFSNKKELDFYDCKISEEFLRTVLPMSPRLQSLCLTSTEFSIVPECIGEFQLLRRLRLINCGKLEEIRGIPPNIEEFFVVNSESLSALTREMLLDQKLHEEGQDKMFILPEPEERLPMWFEYRRRDLSIAFWFRNKFPAISFGLFTWSDPLNQSKIRPRLTINGAKSFQLVAHDYESLDENHGVGHILIFSKTQTTFRDQVGEALSENEWKRAVIAVYDDEPFNGNELDCVQVGIHIIKEKSCMDDIRFTDPLSQNQCDTLREQQSYSARFLEWQCDTVKFNSRYTTNLNVQDLQEEQNFRFWYIQEEQNLTPINQHNLEGCESFGAGNGKNPLTELLSTTKPEQLVVLDLSRNCSNSVQVAELLKKKFENMRVLRFDYCKHITKIPNLSSAPKLEVLSFVCCYELTEIDESVGSLDKLKTLDAFGCRKLRSLPPLMLPSLKYLNLKDCSSLESFPEILGKMECVTRLFLSSYHIKKLPYSIHNLTGLQSLSLDSCGAVELPRGIMLPGVERLSFYHCEGLLLPIQDDGEEQVSSMPFSNTAHLFIYGCYRSEEFLRIALPMFPRLQFLCLGGENFRVLPECIGEFQFLRKLHLFDCKKLEEIRGIPPNIEELFAIGCTSLSLLTREMLLNKKLYEEGQDKSFILPGERLPVWFEHQRRESSITFWCRNKFPAISFGVLNPGSACFIRAKLTINGTKSFQLVQYHTYISTGGGGLICIFSKTQTAFRDQVDEALSENEWNRAVFSFYYDEASSVKYLGWTVEVGVHIIKERSSMDDIRFTDPLSSTFNDNVNGNSNSKRMSCTTTTLNVQDRAVLNPVESSQAPSYVQTQNIQVPCPTSSGAIVCGEEPHLETCCTVLPTTTEESLRNRVEQSQEDVEMESSLDAGGTHDHSSTTATSEDSKDALKLVQDFTTNVPFTYPDPLKNTEDNGLCEVQQLLLLESEIPATCEPVECTEEEEDWLSLPPSLDDVYCSSDSDSDSEPQPLVASPVEEEPLKDAYNNSLPRKCLVLFLCLLLIVVSLFGSAVWHWCFHRNDILTGTSCESVNKAKGKGIVALTCNSNAAEDDGKKPITESLSTTKAVSGSYESSFHSENVDQLVNSLMEIQAPSPQPLDPLAELERVLQGSYDLPPESTSPTAASSSDIQASEVVIILQNLEPLLDNPLESLVADGEIKHQILDCLSKLGQLEDHIPIPLQSVVEQVRDFYEDLIQNFPSIQQTLVDYSCLEETRSKFLENLNQAKAKQAQIDAEVLRGKVQVEELDAEIADLEIKLKAVVEKRNELKLAIKNGEAEKNKLLKDAPAWLMQSKKVVKKIKSSEHAYKDAQNSKARLEGRLSMLKGAFAANNRKP